VFAISVQVFGVGGFVALKSDHLVFDVSTRAAFSVVRLSHRRSASARS